MTEPAPVDTDEAAPASRTAANRELYSTALLGAVAAGVIILAAGRGWLQLTVPRARPYAALLIDVRGHTLFPALIGLAVVVVLASVLLVVTGAVLRRVLAVLQLVMGAGCAWYAIRGFSTPSPGRLTELTTRPTMSGTGDAAVQLHPGWAVLTLVAALAVLLAAVAVLLRAGRWNAGLSRRYAAPASAAQSADPWRALDRGEDPTLGDG